MLVRHTTIIQVDLENSHKSSSGLMELCVGMSFSENHFVIYFVVQPCSCFKFLMFTDLFWVQREPSIYNIWSVIFPFSSCN